MATLAEQARRLNWRGAENGRRGAQHGARGGIALITDRERMPDPLPLLDRLPPGGLVVLRHYGAPDRAALAAVLARACRARRLELVVAEDFDLAIRLSAGLHLPEGLARSGAARVRLWHRRTGKTLTAAAHSRMALVRAAALGADLAFLSPVFATVSHPGAPALGAVRFRALARGARLPVWALGGMTKESVRRLGGSKAAGVGAVGGLSRD